LDPDLLLCISSGRDNVPVPPFPDNLIQTPELSRELKAKVRLLEISVTMKNTVNVAVRGIPTTPQLPKPLN
jgi:hypothetical protein